MHATDKLICGLQHIQKVFSLHHFLGARTKGSTQNYLDRLIASSNLNLVTNYKI